jgi:hypothetical protein
MIEVSALFWFLEAIDTIVDFMIGVAIVALLGWLFLR